jgi:nucleoside-diphosphate-sugar epimerase
MAMRFFNALDLPVNTARPFNTYGPPQSARAVIPTIISQIANGIKQIKLGDGTPTRDSSYVTNSCRWLVAIARSPRTIRETVNIGSNFEILIGNVLNLIRELMGSSVEFVADEQRMRPGKSEVFRLWCDNTKTRELTGFVPEYSIRDGLKSTVYWFTRAENLARYKVGI